MSILSRGHFRDRKIERPRMKQKNETSNEWILIILYRTFDFLNGMQFYACALCGTFYQSKQQNKLRARVKLVCTQFLPASRVCGLGNSFITMTWHIFDSLKSVIQVFRMQKSGVMVFNNGIGYSCTTRWKKKPTNILFVFSTQWCWTIDCWNC